MIISVAELRQFVTTEESDQVLQIRIEALESFICKVTNNDFLSRETGQKNYPADVKMGAINVLKWELSGMREKVGISSETLSRHSVTYADSSNSDSIGYPSSVIGFLKPYMRARF